MNKFADPSPWAPWNGPFADDPFAPWNSPMYKNDPFAAWNSPIGSGNRYGY